LKSAIWNSFARHAFVEIAAWNGYKAGFPHPLRPAAGAAQGFENEEDLI
jgi:hypothetical protein